MLYAPLRALRSQFPTRERPIQRTPPLPLELTLSSKKSPVVIHVESKPLHTHAGEVVNRFRGGDERSFLAPIAARHVRRALSTANPIKSSRQAVVREAA